MSKWWAILLLTLVSTTISTECFGQECKADIAEDQEELTITEAIILIDRETRQNFWYYLRRAKVVFQASIETPDNYIHFFIYRNIVGTFLVVSSWERSAQVAHINTFVRLGNGYHRDVETPYSPVSIQPFIISLRLMEGEYMIDMDENGDFVVRGQLIDLNVAEEQNLKQTSIEEKVEDIDEYTREKYWYYLNLANRVHHQTIMTNERIYVVLTYINVVGTFLVIGSCNDENAIQINTFVRLGAGIANAHKLVPIVVKPILIELA